MRHKATSAAVNELNFEKIIISKYEGVIYDLKNKKEFLPRLLKILCSAYTQYTQYTQNNRIFLNTGPIKTFFNKISLFKHKYIKKY